MARLTTMNEIRQPAAALVNYETGRLDWKQTLIFVGAGIIALAFAFLPLQLAVALWPKPYETYNGYQGIGLAGSSVLGLTLFGLGVYLVSLPLRREHAYHWRQRMAFLQDLESRAAGNDVIIETETNAYDFDTDNFSHMLMLTTMVWFLSRERRSNAPWAVRNLQGPLMIGRVGTGLTISEYQARDARRLLATVGIVEADTEKSAGRLVPGTLEEAVRQLSERWNRIPVAEE